MLKFVPIKLTETSAGGLAGAKNRAAVAYLPEGIAFGIKRGAISSARGALLRDLGWSLIAGVVAGDEAAAALAHLRNVAMTSGR